MRENFATVLETVADEMGEHPAIRHGEQSRSWLDLDTRAARLAGHLAGRGVGAGQRVAIALYNGIEYVETLLAILKLRAVPVNVNYRYKESELRYLLRNAEARAMVFDSSLAGRVARVRPEVEKLGPLVQVSTVEAEESVDAVDYAEAMLTPPLPRQERSDDEWLLYTGGTTGQPKGVLSRHSWLFSVAVQSSYAVLDVPVPATLAELAATTRRIRDEPLPLVCLPVAPLMHGAGIYNTLVASKG